MQNQPIKFTKEMAIDVLYDLLSVELNERTKGEYSGLVSGFYLSGIFTKEEWQMYSSRVCEYAYETDDYREEVIQ